MLEQLSVSISSPTSTNALTDLDVSHKYPHLTREYFIQKHINFIKLRERVEELEKYDKIIETRPPACEGFFRGIRQLIQDLDNATDQVAADTREVIDLKGQALDDIAEGGLQRALLLFGPMRSRRILALARQLRAADEPKSKAISGDIPSDNIKFLPGTGRVGEDELAAAIAAAREEGGDLAANIAAACKAEESLAASVAKADEPLFRKLVGRIERYIDTAAQEEPVSLPTGKPDPKLQRKSSINATSTRKIKLKL
jgi:hypothetical protein